MTEEILLDIITVQEPADQEVYTTTLQETIHEIITVTIRLQEAETVLLQEQEVTHLHAVPTQVLQEVQEDLAEADLPVAEEVVEAEAADAEVNKYIIVWGNIFYSALLITVLH